MINGVETAAKSLTSGLTRLSSWNGAQDDRLGAVADLAQGFEHLLKWTLVLVTHQESGEIPADHDLKRLGHHPLKVLDALLLQAPSGSILADDRDFLSTDGDFREMLAIFGDYGAGGRYSALDGVIDDEIKQTPLMRLEVHESSIHQRYPHLFELQKKGELRRWIDEWYSLLAECHVTTLQRGLRAISRMWTIGPASEEGKLASVNLHRFLFKQDHSLGQVGV